MVRKKERKHIRFFMAESPLFVYKNESLQNTMLRMKKYDVSFLTVVENDSSIKGIISRKNVFKKLNESEDNKNKSISEFLEKKDNLLLLYPMSTTFEAVIAMKTIKSKFIPVANNPWEKKLVGVLWLNDIQNTTEVAFS